MLLVWSGLVFLAVRDVAFLAYFAYVATFGLYMTVNTGFAFQYLWPDSPRWANTVLIVLLNLALITALQFSLTILRARDYTPRLFVVARVLQAMALVAIMLIPLFNYAVLVRPVTFLILVSVCFMIALGVISLLLGSRPARFYVIAWGAFLCGSVVFLFKNFGLVPHTFVTQHSWQVGALVEMILLSMTLSSRMSELQHQSRTDPLTLLGNRRQFDVNLPAEFARALQNGQPLSLLVIDIDQFKLYNDLHGHAQGDEAVKAVAAGAAQACAQALQRVPLRRRRILRHPSRHFRSVGRGAGGTPARRGSTRADGRRNRHGQHWLCVSDSWPVRKRRPAVRSGRRRPVFREGARPQHHRHVPGAPQRRSAFCQRRRGDRGSARRLRPAFDFVKRPLALPTTPVIESTAVVVVEAA